MSRKKKDELSEGDDFEDYMRGRIKASRTLMKQHPDVMVAAHEHANGIYKEILEFYQLHIRVERGEIDDW